MTDILYPTTHLCEINIVDNMTYYVDNSTGNQWKFTDNGTCDDDITPVFVTCQAPPAQGPLIPGADYISQKDHLYYGIEEEVPFNTPWCGWEYGN